MPTYRTCRQCPRPHSLPLDRDTTPEDRAMHLATMRHREVESRLLDAAVTARAPRPELDAWLLRQAANPARPAP